jgi:low affinity Fe/Cu permease
MRNLFRRFASGIAGMMGSPWAFVTAALIVILWALTGPLFRFSDSWQLTINTGTTIVTFLMVFVIQNTQNRDALALHLKLDELLRAVAEARTSLVDLEELSDEEIKKLQQQFRVLHETEAARVRNGDEGAGRSR